MPPRENDPLPAQGEYEYWRHLSEAVLRFLEEPRDWKALDQWAKEVRFGKSRLRQTLAWLEQRAEAGTFVEARSQAVFWVSAAWLQRHNGPPHSRT